MRLCVALAWPLPKDDQLCRWDIICRPVSNCTTGQLPVQLFGPGTSGTVPDSPERYQYTDLTAILGDVLVSQSL